jgi:hypothetical protein
MHEYKGLEKGETEAAIREVPDHKYSGVLESEDSDEEIGQQEDLDFIFQETVYPNCQEPTHLCCCCLLEFSTALVRGPSCICTRKVCE